MSQSILIIRTVLLALLVAPALASNQATVTPGTWNAYAGTSIVSRDHPTVEACAEALEARAPGNYTCRTIARVVVTEVEDIARVAWIPPTHCTDGSTIAKCPVVGYRIHYGRAANKLTKVVQTGNVTSYQVKGLAAGAWYFTVQALSTNSQSDPSNTVVKNF